MAANNNQNHLPTEQQAQRHATRAKIRTIRIWAFIVLGLLAALGLLSNCALSKPKAKQLIVDSCVKNVPFSGKWQAGLKAIDMADKSTQLIHGYCVCMWDKPLEKLNDKQIRSLGKISPQAQLELLGGAQAFEARDKQCMSALRSE